MEPALAEDIAHDAFLKAPSRLRLMHDRDRFSVYLRRTVETNPCDSGSGQECVEGTFRFDVSSPDSLQKIDTG